MERWTAAALVLVVLACPQAHVRAGETDGILPSLRSRATYREVPRPSSVPADQELELAGATVGDIDILIGNVFDTDDPGERSAVPRIANRLHMRTREKTIEDQLLFKSGEAYSGRSLQETERLLRSTRYLYDARVRPIAWHDGQVDIEVRTRDVWTMNPGFSFGRKGGETSSGFELEELNLLGTGSQVSLGFESGIDRDSTTLLYRNRHLLGSWWDLKAQTSDNSDGRTHDFALEQPFYALDTRWAAGVSASDDSRIEPQYDAGHVVNQFLARERAATVFGGWSAGLQDNGSVHRWTAGFTFDDAQFSSAPDPLRTRDIPDDRTLAYPWIGYEWVQDRFFKARNRDQIEKTEDFYLGWRFTARLGYASPAFGADREALILNSALAKGVEPRPGHTLLWNTSVSSRYEHSQFTDLLASASGRYYFRQSANRLFFAALNVDESSRLDKDRQILLGGDSGLRGYPLRFQAGEGRALLTLEQRAFSNWYPFRLFNVGGAVFLDAGRTWGDNLTGSPSPGLLTDFGVGLRLGNSRSALGNMVHIDLAFPMNGGGSLSKMQLVVETKTTF